MQKLKLLIITLLLFTTPLTHAMNSRKRDRPSEGDTPPAKRIKTTETNNTITLVSSNGKELTLPKEIACISGTIQNMLKDVSNTEGEVPLAAIDYQTLCAIKILMELEYSLTQVNNIIKNNEPGLSEDHAMRESIKKCIAQRKLMNSSPINTQDLAKLFYAAAYLDTYAILNAIIHTYAKPHLPGSSVPIIDFAKAIDSPEEPNYMQYSGCKNIHKLIAIGIPKDAIYPLAKTYFILHKEHIIEPSIWLNMLGLSINDYLYEKKNFNPIKKTFLPVPCDIDLSKEKLTTIDGLQNLAVTKGLVDAIDLSHNWIAELADNAFANYENVSLVNLHCNRLTTFNSKTFIGCNNLQTLDLSNNCFANLTNPDTFKHVPNLTKLVLAHCLIKKFDPKILAPLKKLELLDLRNNPWPRNEITLTNSVDENKKTIKEEKEKITTNIKKHCPSLNLVKFTFSTIPTTPPRQQQRAPRPPRLRRTQRYTQLPIF